MEHQYKLPLYTLSVFNLALKGVLLKKNSHAHSVFYLSRPAEGRLADTKCIGGQYEWPSVWMLKELTSNKLMNICKINGQSVPISFGAN